MRISYWSSDVCSSDLFKFYDPTCKPALLGFQIADANGQNIQGDDNDPSGLPSFHILNEFEATEVMANFGQQHSLTLQPIYEGDIQEPSFADIDRKSTRLNSSH